MGIVQVMSEKLKKTLETTQMLHFVKKKDDVLRQAYYNTQERAGITSKFTEF